MGVNPYIQGTHEPTMQISHNFEHDTIEIRRIQNGVPMICSIPRHLTDDTSTIVKQMQLSGFNEYEIYMLLRSPLRAGTAHNDINALNTPYHHGSYYAGSQNAHKPPKAFPRSEQEMDAIMIRRVNARLRLKQEKHWRHLKVAGIAVAAAWLLPVLAAIFARTWGFALAWIAA